MAEGMQEGYNNANSSQEVAWGLCANPDCYIPAMRGMNKSSLHREVKSRRGQKGSSVETKWVDLNGKDNIAITDSN